VCVVARLRAAVGADDRDDRLRRFGQEDHGVDIGTRDNGAAAREACEDERADHRRHRLRAHAEGHRANEELALAEDHVREDDAEDEHHQSADEARGDRGDGGLARHAAHRAQRAAPHLNLRRKNRPQRAAAAAKRERLWPSQFGVRQRKALRNVNRHS